MTPEDEKATGNEPDFSYQTAAFLNKAAWFQKSADEMRENGATVFQASVHETIPDLILMEGWKVRPTAFPPPFFHLFAYEDVT